MARAARRADREDRDRRRQACLAEVGPIRAAHRSRASPSPARPARRGGPRSPAAGWRSRTSADPRDQAPALAMRPRTWWAARMLSNSSCTSGTNRYAAKTAYPTRTGSAPAGSARPRNRRGWWSARTAAMRSRRSPAAESAIVTPKSRLAAVTWTGPGHDGRRVGAAAGVEHRTRPEHPKPSSSQARAVAESSASGTRPSLQVARAAASRDQQRG